MAEMERTHSNEGSPSISKERNKVRIHDEFGTSNMLDMPKHRIIPGKPIGNTLNKPARLNEMKRIQQDNEQMLKRLQDRQSVYNVQTWESERKNQVKTLRRICKYGLSIAPKTSRKSRRRGAKKSNNPLLLGLDTENYEGSIDQDVYSKDLSDIQTKHWHDSKYKGPNREIYEQMSIAKDNEINQSERGIFSADANLEAN